MVVLDPGTEANHGRDGVWCDPCLAPIVKALNDGGVRTVASCCGHGATLGSIALADGRVLAIEPTLADFMGRPKSLDAAPGAVATIQRKAAADALTCIADSEWEYTPPFSPAFVRRLLGNAAAEYLAGTR